MHVDEGSNIEDHMFKLIKLEVRLEQLENDVSSVNWQIGIKRSNICGLLLKKAGLKINSKITKHELEFKVVGAEIINRLCYLKVEQQHKSKDIKKISGTILVPLDYFEEQI